MGRDEEVRMEPHWHRQYWFNQRLPKVGALNFCSVQYSGELDLVSSIVVFGASREPFLVCAQSQDIGTLVMTQLLCLAHSVLF